MVSEAKLSKVLEEQGYRYHDFLGKGGFGTVVSAWQTVKVDKHTIERLVAIKTLNPNAPKEAKDGFFREAEISLEEKYRHDGIVEGLDMFKEGNLYNLVTKYVVGPNLKEIIKRDKVLPIEFSSAVIYKIGKVLEFLHDPKRSVTHRDIKPANIIITNDGRVYLLDFGSAKIGSMSDDVFVGTPPYMSPEQIKGNANPQSDMWSLGVTYYEALTSEKPFRSGKDDEQEYMQDIFAKVLERKFDSPRKLDREIPKKVSNIVKKSLGGVKFLGIPILRRYQSANELTHDLENCFGFNNGNVDDTIKDYISTRNIFGNLGHNPEIDYFEYPNYRHPENLEHIVA